MALDTLANVKSYVLSRANENTNGTSPFDTLVDDLIIESWKDLNTRHPWLGNVKYPPGVLLTQAAITTLTLTVATAGTSVAGTLSAAPASSLDIDNFLILPNGKDYILRVTTHTGGGTAVTLDAAPEVLTARACTIVPIEYDIASDVALFVDGLWTENGAFVSLRSEEDLKRHWHGGPPPQGWPPRMFARIGTTKIRLSSYGSARERLDYPYTMLPADPTVGTLSIAAYLRPVLANGVLSLLYERKEDARLKIAAERYERGISRAKDWEQEMRLGQGSLSSFARGGPYQD